MGFVKAGIQLLIVFKHFILLVILNMPAHHNDSLTHQKHKKSTQQRQGQNGKPANNYNAYGRKSKALHVFNKLCNGNIVHRLFAPWLVAWQGSLGKVYNKACDLRRQYAKVVRDNNEKYAYTQPEFILPEIFIDCLKLLQLKKFERQM